ncbi:MAG: HAD-IA family hydrolase [Chloroflexi bacterium]|nr:HAD-IA family hydrolase [Chloroflexota bacterium]
MDALFDHILISAQIGVMKPDVTAFRVALQTVGAAPGEVVLIDDSLTNIRAAQAMGMHAVLVRPETDVRAELQPYLDDPSP